MATTKRFLSLLLLAIATSRLTARHMSSLLSNDIDNSISTSAASDTSADASNKPIDWVRISISPTPTHRAKHIELECEAVGSPPPIITWEKDGKPLAELDAYDTNLLDEGTTHALAKVRSRLFAYYAGVYTCVAQAGSQVATAETHVHGLQGLSFRQIASITRKPAKIVLYDTVYMDHIGKDIILPCSAEGSPQPEVFWLDPDDNLIADGGRFSSLPSGALLIKNIRWNDMGPYTCYARNSINDGEVKEDSITTFLYPMLAEKK